MGDPAGIGGELSLRAWLARAATACRSSRSTIPTGLRRHRPRARPRRADPRGRTPIDAARAVFREALPVLPVPLAAPPRPGDADPGQRRRR